MVDKGREQIRVMPRASQRQLTQNLSDVGWVALCAGLPVWWVSVRHVGVVIGLSCTSSDLTAFTNTAKIIIYGPYTVQWVPASFFPLCLLLLCLNQIRWLKFRCHLRLRICLSTNCLCGSQFNKAWTSHESAETELHEREKFSLLTAWQSGLTSAVESR